MKTEAEIQAKLDELMQDIRLTKYEPANVAINAPLALHQCAGYAKMRLLRWILEEPRDENGRADQS